MFAAIGGQLLFANLTSRIVGYSIAVIVVGVFFRLSFTFICSQSKKFTIKERIYMSVCWIPKLTVPATLSGYFVSYAKGTVLEEFAAVT